MSVVATAGCATRLVEFFRVRQTPSSSRFFFTRPTSTNTLISPLVRSPIDKFRRHTLSEDRIRSSTSPRFSAGILLKILAASANHVPHEQNGIGNKIKPGASGRSMLGEAGAGEISVADGVGKVVAGRTGAQGGRSTNEAG